MPPRKPKKDDSQPRVAALRERMRDAGLVQVAVWCAPATAEKIKQLAAMDRRAVGIGPSDD